MYPTLGRPARISLAATLVMALAACGSDSSSGDSGETTNLRMYVAWSQPEAVDLLREYAGDFHEENPTIEVEIQHIPSDSLNQKLRSDLVANTMPDIAINSSLDGELDIHALNGWADLSSYMTPEWIEEKQFVPNALSEMEEFAVPFLRTPLGHIFYNKHAFADAGITPPPVNGPAPAR